MDDWLDLIEDDHNDALVIEPGNSYTTYQGSRADIVYFIDGSPFYFFGHVHQETENGIMPIAVQWSKEGKVDQTLYDIGYDLVGYWVKPKKYTRYVYIYRDKDETKTVITERPINISHKILAERKVILTGL